MQVSYWGSYHVAKALLPSMTERGSAHLCFIASAAVLSPLVGARALGCTCTYMCLPHRQAISLRNSTHVLFCNIGAACVCASLLGLSLCHGAFACTVWKVNHAVSLCLLCAGFTSYAPPKAAVRALADALRSELVSTGVSVSVAYPPDTATPGFEKEEKVKPAETKALAKFFKVRRHALTKTMCVHSPHRECKCTGITAHGSMRRRRVSDAVWLPLWAKYCTWSDVESIMSAMY